MTDQELTIENWLWDMYGSRSLQRTAEFRPTATISRGTGPVRGLPTTPIELGNLTLESRTGETITLDQHLETSSTEGLVVIQDGSIVYERYLNGLQPDTRHLLASVTKSMCATLLGIELAKGTLTREALVADVAPEFTGSSIADATIGQIIDMTAGTAFEEMHDTLSEQGQISDVTRFMQQAGTLPLGGVEPIGTLALFRQFGLAYAHGDHFEYRTPLTCAMGRILEIATGRPYVELFSDEVWSQLGMEHDAAIIVDTVGFPFTGGGMPQRSATSPATA